MDTGPKRSPMTIRVRGELSKEWVPQVGDVLCIPRTGGWYDHSVVVTDVYGDGKWSGIHLDEGLEAGDMRPGLREIFLTGLVVDVLPVDIDEFEDRYGETERVIEVVRREVLPGFQDRVDHMLKKKRQLYQMVPNRPDAMNCQIFHNWLLCGEGWSPDSDAVISAMHTGVMGGGRAARNAVSKWLTRAPWDPIVPGPVLPFMRRTGNNLANIFVGVVIVVMILLVFLFGVASRAAVAYERHRLGVIQRRGDDCDGLSFSPIVDVLRGRNKPKGTKRCLGRPRSPDVTSIDELERI
jgi:hypothetical protein